MQFQPLKVKKSASIRIQTGPLSAYKSAYISAYMSAHNTLQGLLRRRASGSLSSLFRARAAISVSLIVFLLLPCIGPGAETNPTDAKSSDSNRTSTIEDSPISPSASDDSPQDSPQEAPELSSETGEEEQNDPPSVEGSPREGETSDYSDFDLSEFDKPYHLGGFFRQGIQGLKPFYPLDKKYTDLTSESRLRLKAEYSDGPLQAEISGNGDFVFTNHPQSPAFAPLHASSVRNRLLSMETIQNHGDYLVRGDIHRLNAAYKGTDFHITFGRQAISWGEGRLLNPMDLITPVGPLIQDLEDVPGADAINTSYFFNSYDSIQLVIAPYTRSDERDLGRLRSQDATSILRYKGTFGNLDMVFLGGRQHRSYVWGTELNLTIWDAGFRFAYLGRQEDEKFHKDYLAQEDTHQFVLGASYAFWGELRTNLEFFYNSRPYGEDPYIPEQQQKELEVASKQSDPSLNDESFFRTRGRILTRNPYLVQASVGYNLTELITGDLFAIWDPEGGSVLYGPQFSFNASNEIIIVAGARLYSLGSHPEEAEFQGAPPQAFVYMRWHF